MRGFFTVILFIIFFFTFPIALFTFAFNQTFTPNLFKSSLYENDVYQILADEVPNLVTFDENKVDIIPKIEKDKITAFLEKEVTKDYFQTKAETFIDDTFLWLEGQRPQAPTISFVDLKEKMKGMAVVHILPKDIDGFISKPIEPFKSQEQIKEIIKFVRIAPIIFGVLSMITLIGIVFLAKGWKSRLRRLSLAILLAVISGFVLYVPIVFFATYTSEIIHTILGVAEPNPLLDSTASVLRELPNELGRRIFLELTISLAISIVLFIASFFVERKKEPAPSVT